MYEKLVPLKIPMGWAILKNSFGGEDQIIRDGKIVNDKFYNEDLLSISELKYTDEGWAINPNGYLIDLGWYPESEPNGHYRLILLREDWNNVLLKFESKDRWVIKKAIEKCFKLINQGIDDKLISVSFHKK